MGKTLFEFDFHPRNSEHYWISESKALTAKGGTVQFIASGRNAFIYNQVSTAGSVSTWTATRSGVDLAADARSAPTAKQSMLQRWGKWLGGLALFLAYRSVKELAGKLSHGQGEGVRGGGGGGGGSRSEASG